MLYTATEPDYVKMKQCIFHLRLQGVGHAVSLLDRIGALVIEYKCDVWGKPLSIFGDILSKRTLLRYYGYVYD